MNASEADSLNTAAYDILPLKALRDPHTCLSSPMAMFRGALSGPFFFPPLPLFEDPPRPRLDQMECEPCRARVLGVAAPLVAGLEGNLRVRPE